MSGRVFMLRGAPWRVIFPRKMSNEINGLCTLKKTGKGGTIRVLASLDDPKKMEVLIHEAVHACHWDLDEEAVHETARDIAALLWRLGYRRTDPPSG